MDNIVLYDILVGSVNKALKHAKSKGKLDLYDLHLLSLFGKLLNDFNTTLTLSQKTCLEEAIRGLQNKNSYICNYKYKAGSITNTNVNAKPTVVNGTITVPNLTYNFKYSDFNDIFTDSNGDNSDKVRINILPTEGKLQYKGIDVILKDEISISDINNLIYIWEDYTDKEDSFSFQINDNNINNPLFSDMATMTINITAHVNLPPSQVGEFSMNISSGQSYIFTQDDFTTNTSPVYLDPDGDPAKDLKITVLPLSGVLNYDGDTVYQNDIIPFDDIGGDLFSYIPDANNLLGHQVTFDFSISDTGSNQFTSGGVATLNIDAYVNQAPVIGDGIINVDEGDITTFTRSMFTTSTNPAYNDPEGDLATNLRVTILPLTGNIKLNNVNITANQVISFADIDSGLLTYVQASNAGSTIPEFTFNIQDSAGNWSN